MKPLPYFFLGALLIACSFAANGINDEEIAAAAVDGRQWLSFGQGYANQNYSALNQIDTGSVSGLKPVWNYSSGKTGSFQAQPLVAGGVMYITLPGNDVIALDAETGDEVWHYQHRSRFEKTKGGPANRGAALGYGKVFEATNDGRLIALDQYTGAVLWETTVAQATEADTAGLNATEAAALAANISKLPVKVPPLVYDGKVIVGVTSAGYGIYYDFVRGVVDGGAPPANKFLGLRGYIAAYDAHDGQELWRWHTTKGGAWEGGFRAATPEGEALPRDIADERAAAAKHRDAWRVGGSSTWMTPALDPELGLIYAGTGNASPNDAPQLRPGDNLYANSLVAIDVHSGATRWHYQQVPHDLWGYDLASPAVLFDIGGIPAVSIASKTGWVYVHDRRNGELLFRSEALVPHHNMFAEPTTQGVVGSPGSFGGVSWSPTSFDANTGLLYVPAIHKPTTYSVRQALLDSGPVTYIYYDVKNNEPSWGTLSAVDTRDKGKIAWQIKTPEPLIGGVLATAGGVLFMGEGNGRFNAFDSSSGARLWAYDCGAGVNAPAMSYEINGRQYVAVAAGGHRYLGFPGGDTLHVFALE
ncbi:MAG: PQQ-binding-like beta-propeller repeat protein [Pseudomonadota bacterium]